MCSKIIYRAYEWFESYIDRLVKLGMDSLERRRLNQDVMLRYKFQITNCDSEMSGGPFYVTAPGLP